MVMINLSNIASVLGKVGIKICSGINGKKCMNMRRDGGRLCLVCHKTYMKENRKGTRSRVRVVGDYDFNQTSEYTQ